MCDTLAGKVKSTNELTVVYDTVIVVTDYCLNNNRGNWIIVIIHFLRLFPDFSYFPWFFPDHFSIPWLFQVFQKSGHPVCKSKHFPGTYKKTRVGVFFLSEQCRTGWRRVSHKTDIRMSSVKPAAWHTVSVWSNSTLLLQALHQTGRC